MSGKTYKSKCGRFEIGHILTPEDMAGSIEPFEPCWNVQYLADGTQEFFDTEKECLEWIKNWPEVKYL